MEDAEQFERSEAVPTPQVAQRRAPVIDGPDPSTIPVARDLDRRRGSKRRGPSRAAGAEPPGQRRVPAYARVVPAASRPNALGMPVHLRNRVSTWLSAEVEQTIT
jgi:hypothetical protein